MTNNKIFEIFNTTKPQLNKRHPDITRDRLVGTANAQLIRDITGKELGVRAPEGSAFKIFFSFDGTYLDGTITDILNECSMSFELRNERHQVVYTAPVLLFPEECIASVDIISEQNGILKYGNYFINLTMLLDGVTYTLFSELDGVVSIE